MSPVEELDIDNKNLPGFFECAQCNAQLEFSPETQSLKCDYCGYENIPAPSRQNVEELDYHQYLQQALKNAPFEERLTVKCDQCGAEVTTEADRTSHECPYCGADIVMTALSKKLIKPRALLPFKITEKEALSNYRSWCANLWFAPNSLKKMAKIEGGFKGMYLPYWTYDAGTHSQYRGERGEYYYVTEKRTRTDSEGKSYTEDVEVRHTHWYSTSGHVDLDFNDILVMASGSLPGDYSSHLEPWDLENLQTYRDEYVSGFRVESYQINLNEGFEKAKQIMEEEINDAILEDIGGDDQRIFSVNTQYEDITFKHILLPVWFSAYRYNGSIYSFMVNARTGEVQGDRPWSLLKITVLIFSIAMIIGFFLLYYNDIFS